MHKNKAKTQVTDVLLALIIDESGSMGSLVGDTIGGLNMLLNEQRVHPDGRCFISETIFDTEFRTPYVAVDVKEVPDFAPPGQSENWYQPRGGTALLDAVGITIQGIEGWLTNHPEFTGKVKVVIWTDGEENSSRLYNYESLMAQIAVKQAEGWIFDFLGTGGSAWTEGRKFATTIGVSNTANVVHTAAGYRASYAAASNSTSTLRSTGANMDTMSSYAASYNPAEDPEVTSDTLAERLSTSKGKKK